MMNKERVQEAIQYENELKRHKILSQNNLTWYVAYNCKTCGKEKPIYKKMHKQENIRNKKETIFRFRMAKYCKISENN